MKHYCLVGPFDFFKSEVVALGSHSSVVDQNMDWVVLLLDDLEESVDAL